MKKIFLSLVFIFAFVAVTPTSAKSNESNKSVEVRYPDCWAAADAAETNTCGSVGCNFDLWAAVYTACQNQ